MRSSLAILTLLAAGLSVAPVPVATSATAATSAATAHRGTETARTTDLATIRRQVVRLTNERRRDRGCRALRQVASLNLAAQRHTRLMARRDTLTHQFAGEPDPGVRIRRAGYDWNGWAENVAAGYTTPEAVVRGWMNSRGHRRNILNCRFRHIGVGYARSDDGTAYWTQDFGYR